MMILELQTARSGVVSAEKRRRAHRLTPGRQCRGFARAIDACAHRRGHICWFWHRAQRSTGACSHANSSKRSSLANRRACRCSSVSRAREPYVTVPLCRARPRVSPPTKAQSASAMAISRKTSHRYPGADMPASLLCGDTRWYCWLAVGTSRDKSDSLRRACLPVFRSLYPAADAAGLYAFHASELPFVFGAFVSFPVNWPARSERAATTAALVRPA